jgi:2-polyprenyl-3-methyl-5-hydroxy-6-metoxy-1,4-benzoquinol methylase
VTCFDVIEHVDDPELLLKNCRYFMDRMSTLTISTPRTTEPVLNPRYYYRTQHRWYFNDKSLDYLATKVGLFRTRQWITGEGDNQQLYQRYIRTPP